MGMSRVEIIGVMKKIRKELGVPPRHYDHYDVSPTRFKGPRKKKCASKKQRKKSSQKEKVKVTGPKIKQSQLPPQHVPGPKHLHTNICVRPWEAKLDGWNQVETLKTEDVKSSNPWITFKNNILASKGRLKQPAVVLAPKEDDDGDYITLEIFNPIFGTRR